MTQAYCNLGVTFSKRQTSRGSPHLGCDLQGYMPHTPTALYREPNYKLEDPPRRFTLQTLLIETPESLTSVLTPGIREIRTCGPQKCPKEKTEIRKLYIKYTSLKELQNKIDSFFFSNKVLPTIHIEDLLSEEKKIMELAKNHNSRYRAAHFGKWYLIGEGPSKHGYYKSNGVIGNAEGSLFKNLPHDPKHIFSITNSAVV